MGANVWLCVNEIKPSFTSSKIARKYTTNAERLKSISLV
jgi:hypothetical protein